MTSELIHSKIADVRRKHALVAACTGAAGAISSLILVLAGTMLLDYWRELPTSARAAALAVNLALAAVIILRYAVIPTVFGPDDEQVALWVERAEPVFRTRLIASVQFLSPEAAPAGASPGLLRAMIAQTEELAQAFDFSRVIETTRLLRLATLAAMIVLAALAGLAFGRQDAGDLLRRALLVPGVEVPRKTRVECISKDQVIPKGEAVTLAAEARGVEPPQGRLEIHYASGSAQNFLLERDAKTGRFQTTIDNLQESFEYAIFLNDGHSQTFKVEAVARPAVSQVECMQVYPKYTRLGTMRRSPGDLSLLEGSRLRLNVSANKPLRVAQDKKTGNHVHLVGSEVDYALLADINDPSKLTTGSDASGLSLPRGTKGFSIHLVDDNGIWSKDPVVYPVDLVADKPPSLKITFPERKDELVTQRARIIVGFDASDDYALAKVVLHYKIDKLDEGQEKTIDLEIGEYPKSVRGHYEWELARIAPPVGSVIQWWLEAVDGNDFTGPGKTASEPFQARVVTEEEKRKELVERLGSYWEKIKNVAESEQDLNAKLGNAVIERK